MKRTTMARNAVVGVGVLISSLLIVACKEPPPWSQPGPLFDAPESPPAGKALVYIYWPAESSGRARRAWIRPSDGVSEEIFKGGYLSIPLAPGTTSLFASLEWNLAIGHTFASQECGGVRLDNRRGEVLYLKMKEDATSVLPRFGFREVEPAKAVSEIKKCRRMVPL